LKLVSVFLQIEKEISAGSLSMPALPVIALKVREAVKDPNMDLVQLSKVVSLDSAFTAYLISLANSPIYRGVGKIESVPVALGRIGLESTKASALRFAIRSLFTTKDRASKLLLNKVWRESCNVSALAYVMAKTLKTADPETASIAGLLHNVGMIPVILKLVAMGETEKSIIENWQTVFKFSRKIGLRILASWGMEDELKEVVSKVTEWQVAHENSLVDLINLALWHSYLGTAQFKTLPRLNELGHFQNNIMLELDNGSLLFVNESRDEVKNMMKALNG